MNPRPRTPERWMLIAIAVALLTMAIKTLAWRLTGSVGLLSDALESLVNLGAAMMGFAMLRLAFMPADAGHEYGHGKAEYLASGFEGALIAIAAASIIYSAWPRLFAPQPIEQIGVGLAVAAGAAVLNGVTAVLMRRAAHRHQSTVLAADAAHLLTDVWTTAGVIVAVLLVTLTGWWRLDPLIALLVALGILRTGWHLLRQAADGLMDAAWPADERAQLDRILQTHQQPGVVDFHAVRTRRAGTRRFVAFHMLVPGHWPVQRAHDAADRIEAQICAQLAPVTVLTHLEPIEDPIAHQDLGLDRNHE
ncbi:cation diffusion facilitator family transporter [Sinimarinibacterium sp. NLF-5-8]|uniref:cation diffusion facilitator family transporter n=1 Tax=Sinimarinibacterium sp. NLF-5-8 TaxID=2698684 RepID=UPI00137BC129|nr:cation diffusion facilitator family transporter [Sinimarinibacterium sp. NLF-5-8]QHS09510.1 cation transporter [Sinimarinibacterium sp. NLF-5-8]